MSKHVLIVDDDRSTCSLVEMGLRPEGFEVSSATSGEDALRLLETEDIRVVLTDLNMGSGMSGTDLCRQIVEVYADLPVVVVTAFGSMETAIAAIRAGAYDFLTKPFEMEALVLAVERALGHQELRAEVKRLRAAVGEAGWSDDLIGTSPAMLKLRALLERVAESDATVLVTGESGTGKEVVATTLHQRGRRKNAPLVAVNCAAMPEALLESELFGHVRGAFTDAKAARSGLLVQAHGGTLFLDEIGEMPIGLQPKLLRALEQRKVRPVGGNTEVGFDVRVIASTNRDLETAIEDGIFREDLFYRINVLNVPLPPLRSRGGDVLLLAQHFIAQFAKQSHKEVTGLTSAAAEKLMAYPWPGNIRELRNCIERAVALTRYDNIAPEDLPEKVRGYRSKHVLIAGEDLGDFVPLEEVERRYILRVLEAAGGNKSLASQTLGLNRKTLYRKLAAYGVSEK